MTSLSLAGPDVAGLKTDVLVIGVAKGPKGLALSAGNAAVDKAYGGRLVKVLADLGFQGNEDEAVRVPTLGQLGASSVVAVGLGDAKKVTAETLRRAAGAGTLSCTRDNQRSNHAALAVVTDRAPHLVRPRRQVHPTGERFAARDWSIRFDIHFRAVDVDAHVVRELTRVAQRERHASARHSDVLRLKRKLRHHHRRRGLRVCRHGPATERHQPCQGQRQAQSTHASTSAHGTHSSNDMGSITMDPH